MRARCIERKWAKGVVLAVSLATAGCAAEPNPWFGVTLPPGLGDPHHPVVDVNSTPPPALVPAGEEAFADLSGARIRDDVEVITGFSRADRAAGNRMWGRITGFPAARETVEWAATEFREAGLTDVAVQEYPGTAAMWVPRSWEVRLIADAAFGAGTADVVLESALPTGGSAIEGGSLTAPLVDAGLTTDEALPDEDVTGKIAVQHLEPASGAYSERGRTVERARALMERGAVAVLNVVRQTGNMHVRDFSNCNGPCFNLGTADGAFLDEVMGRAATAGTPVQAWLSLQAETRSGLQGHNAMGIVRGRRETENVIVNAHADGWFDAAGDNADGLAVLVAMARHFAKPEHRPERTVVFVASGGHHSAGLNGPSNFVRMNPDLTKRTVLVLNLEHIAQRRILSESWTVEATEQPMNFGIDNEAPFLCDVAMRGRERYGFNITPECRAGVPGDLGGYAPLGVPRVQAIHSGPMYHVSGDVAATISTPGLERAARFYTYYVNEVARAPRRSLSPGH